MKKAQDYSSILEETGIRPTSTRLLIYEAIAGTKDTFSLGSLEAQLQSIDKSVIFRTLTLFHEHRLIHSVDDGSGSLKYCLCHNHGHCTNEEEHCHFYCECCGKTYCLFDDIMQQYGADYLMRWAYGVPAPKDGQYEVVQKNKHPDLKIMLYVIERKDGYSHPLYIISEDGLTKAW